MSHDHTFEPSYDGGVVVDIGGDVGALVLHVELGLVGREIELEAENGRVRTHSAVRERRGDGPAQYAALYPALTAGRYTVVDSGQEVAVDGGRVTVATLAPVPATRSPR